MFNTLLYTKKLMAAGLSREQAEAHVEMVTELLEESLVTKDDFEKFELKQDAKFEKFAQKMLWRCLTHLSMVSLSNQ